MKISFVRHLTATPIFLPDKTFPGVRSATRALHDRVVVAFSWVPQRIFHLQSGGWDAPASCLEILWMKIPNCPRFFALFHVDLALFFASSNEINFSSLRFTVSSCFAAAIHCAYSFLCE